MSRRAFESGLAAAGLVTVPAMRRPAHAAGEVMYFGWAGYESPGFHGAYTEKYGGSPGATFWATTEEAFQKMRQGFAPDVMHPSTPTSSSGASLVAPLDPDRLEWLPDMFEGLNDIIGSVHDGVRCYMPMDWGNSTVLYRTDVIAPEHAGENLSWAILFEDWYKGRIASYDTLANVQIAGLLLGYDNIFDMTDEQLLSTRPLLEPQRENLRFYWAEARRQRAIADCRHPGADRGDVQSMGTGHDGDGKGIRSPCGTRTDRRRGIDRNRHGLHREKHVETPAQERQKRTRAGSVFLICRRDDPGNTVDVQAFQVSASTGSRFTSCLLSSATGCAQNDASRRPSPCRSPRPVPIMALRGERSRRRSSCQSRFRGSGFDPLSLPGDGWYRASQGFTVVG